MSASPSGKKQKQLDQWLKRDNVGIAMLAEINLFWPAVQFEKSWNPRMRKSTSSGHHSSVAYNVHHPPSGSNIQQHGGCITSVLNQVAHSVKASGCDRMGLGRWAWIKLRGKKCSNPALDNTLPKDLVIISAYRPNHPGKGPTTVWAQHKNFFLDQQRDDEPREAFVKDLIQDIEAWRSKGCEIILGIDANEDVTINSPTSLRQRLRVVGLKDAIQQRHKNQPPATHQSSSKDRPIDAIFVTDGVPIKACGYYPFGERVQSDHRAIWIDFDLHQTLGGFCPTKSTFQARRLTLMDHSSVKRYVSIAEQGYLHFHIRERLSRLTMDLRAQHGKLTARQQHQFNVIHKQAYYIRRTAEKHCRKLRMGGVPWSPVAQESWDKLRLWDMLSKTFKGVRVSSRKLRRLMKKTRLPNAWTYSEKEVLEEWAKEKQKYTNHVKPNAWDLRRRYITVRSQAVKRARHKSRAALSRFNKHKRMKQREETRRRRKAQGKGFTGGLRAIQVEVSTEDGSTSLVTISDQRQVEEGCMQENTARYNQTLAPYPTPPMQEPLYSEFNGPQAESNFQALLQGTYRPPATANLDFATKQFLSACQVPAHLRPMDLSVSKEDHIDFWSKNPENKGSEPHGLHNGHFKAGITSDLLADCDAMIRDIPWESGLCPDQWKHLMNFAIEKKPGELRVKKMRTIQMMNSEMQANNKKIGRSAMSYAEVHRLIPDGQHGSRKQRQAEDAALSKICEWDEMKIQRRSFGWVCNDAKSCFDRIVHWIGLIALLRFGLKYNPLRSMFHTLMSATHRVRTGFGDSTRSFKPPSSISFQGCGQGNGAGPTIWVAVSSILIRVMEKLGYGFIRYTALSMKRLLSSCFSFVDDTDLVQSAPDVNTSGEEILPKIQENLSLWGGLIRSTGGAINPEKSFWWLVDFVWLPSLGRWKFRRCKDMKGSLTLKGLTDQYESLTRKEPNEPERTLGIIMSPEHNDGPQWQHMLDQAKSWAAKVGPSRLLPYDVFPLLRTTILKSLEFPMALTTFSQSALAKLMVPILKVCLPKAGICRSFPRDVVYAPIRYQGLGLPHPYGIQVNRHLDSLLRHTSNRTDTWARFEAVLEGHQLETGTSFGLFQQSYDNTAILTTDTWMKRVWRELDSLDIHLEFETEELELRRDGDVLLMDAFISAEVDQESLKWLNWCRMHLHVTTLSDIVSADGCTILQDSWQGDRTSSQLDRYNWPRTVRPTEFRWNLWRSTLTTVFLSNSGTDHRLRQPLGRWQDSIDRWKWVFAPSTNSLYHRSSRSSPWQLFPPIAGRTRRQRRTFRRPRRPQLVPTTPNDALRADVRLCPTSRVATILSLGLQAVPRTSSKNPQSILDQWREASAHISAHRGWVPDELQILGDEDHLVQALFEGRLKIISDGSYKSGLGSAAVQVTTMDRSSTIWARCQTPGLRQDQSAYRSELIGLLAGIMITSWLLEKGVQSACTGSPAAEIACDGLSALRNSFSIKPLKSTQRQFDLLSAIRALRRSLPVKWRKRHVDGHADRTTSWDDLTWWEQRNVECDKMAQLFRHLLERQGSPEPSNARFFTEPVALFIHGTKRSRLERSRIMELITLPPLLKYWKDRDRPQCHFFAEIEWDAVSRGMQALPFGIQKWTTKHSVGMCSVGKFRATWGLDQANMCPRCGEPEDHLHIPRCQGDGVQEKWEHELVALRQWMILHHTAPEIISAMVAILQEVRSLPAISYSSRDPVIQAAIHSQRKISAQGLLEGRLSTHWIPVQQRYFSSIGRRNSSSLWASRLTQQLILMGFHMWEHRNGVQHSEDNQQTRRTRAALDQSIQDQFDMGSPGLPPQIRPMLLRPIEEVLALPVDDKKRWLRLVIRSRRVRRRALSRQKAMIYKLLRRRTPPSRRKSTKRQRSPPSRQKSTKRHRC